MTSSSSSNGGVLGAAATAGAVVMMASWYLQQRNKTTKADDVINDPPPLSEGLCCPRGHLFEKVLGAEGTCDICHSTLNIRSKKETLVCFDCHGFVVCPSCCREIMMSSTKKKPTQQPLYTTDPTRQETNPFTKSTYHYDKGMKFFQAGEYEKAAAEFKTSLGMRESLARQQKLEIHHSALSAEMLAKSQFLHGDFAQALETINTAASHWEASGQYFQHKANEARLLEQEMERLQKQMNRLKEHVGQIQQPKTSTTSAGTAAAPPWVLLDTVAGSSARNHQKNSSTRKH